MGLALQVSLDCVVVQCGCLCRLGGGWGGGGEVVGGRIKGEGGVCVYVYGRGGEYVRVGVCVYVRVGSMRCLRVCVCLCVCVLRGREGEGVRDVTMFELCI